MHKKLTRRTIVGAARSGARSAIGDDESVATLSVAGSYGDGDDDDHTWDTVTAAGNRPPTIRSLHLPSIGGSTGGGTRSCASSIYSGSQPRHGWARPEKVAQGQEVKWGAADDKDVWGEYSRSLSNRRDAVKKNTKKKRTPQEIEELDEEEDEDWD